MVEGSLRSLKKGDAMRHRRSKRRCAFFFAVLISTVFALPVSSVNAEEYNKDGGSGQECVSVAKLVATGAWSCLGNYLTYEVDDGTGSKWQTVNVGAEPPATLGGDEVGTLSHPTNSEDDFAYEGVSIKNIVHGDYTAWVKGNATYGVSGNVWGTFDVVWRQHFNGPLPQWRIHLIWDSGYAVNSDYWKAQVRKEVNNWPDPVKGVATFYPATISSSNWDAYGPAGGTTFKPADEKITQGGFYHDDMFGYFTANGRSFAAGTLHTGHWNSIWNNTNDYWEQKYTDEWYN